MAIRLRAHEEFANNRFELLFIYIDNTKAEAINGSIGRQHSDCAGRHMEKILGLCDTIRHEVVVAKKTYAQISQELQDSFPSERGFSIRSIRRFCERHDIHSRSQLSDRQIDMVVTSGISKVSLNRQFIR